MSSLIVLFAIIPLTPLLWYRKTALMSCFLLGLGCHLLTHEKPHRDWHRLPQREVSMEIRVTELFNTRRQDRVSGIGIILQTNIPRDTVSAGSISFYLENPGGDSGVGMVGESFRCTGVLTYLPYLDETDGFQQYLNSR